MARRAAGDALGATASSPMLAQRAGQRQCVGHGHAIRAQPLLIGTELDAPAGEAREELLEAGRLLFPGFGSVPKQEEHLGEVEGDLRR